MHVCAGLSIQKSILNYCLIDFRYKKETKRKNFKDMICTGLNSHTLSKWMLEQYQNSMLDKATVHQRACCSVLSPRSRNFYLLVFLVHFTNIFPYMHHFKFC